MRAFHLPDNPDMRAQWRVNQIYWLCILFILVWIVLRAVGIGDGPPLARPAWFFAVLLLGAANLGLRSLSALRPGHDRRSGLFTWLDLLLIALGLRLTGGQESALWVVFFVLVLGETVLSPPREARRICWGAGAALIAGTWSPQVRPAAYIFDIATRLFFLTIVSITTRRLRENAAQKEAELANLRAELAAAGERARLSREIHDGVGNALAAATLRLEVAARVVEKHPNAPEETFKEEARALRETMNSVRDWTFFARPWPTGEPGVSPSELLAREVERLSRRISLPVQLTGADALDTLPETLRIALLRIVQEALTNAAKHAGATQAEVRLHKDEGWVEVHVTDNGRGFDGNQEGLASGIGISSMRERAEALGGTLIIDSVPGWGATITARLPEGQLSS